MQRLLRTIVRYIHSEPSLAIDPEINSDLLPDYEMSVSKATYLDCFRGDIGKRLLTGCGLQVISHQTATFATVHV